MALDAEKGALLVGLTIGHYLLIDRIIDDLISFNIERKMLDSRRGLEISGSYLLAINVTCTYSTTYFSLKKQFLSGNSFQSFHALRGINYMISER